MGSDGELLDKIDSLLADTAPEGCSPQMHSDLAFRIEVGARAARATLIESVGRRWCRVAAIIARVADKD